MSTLKANAWAGTNGQLLRTPVKLTTVIIPYSTATNNQYTYQPTLGGWTTSNTTSIYSFNYTPSLTSSYINYMAFIELDRNNSGNQENCVIFINNNPYSVAYNYPRNQGHEVYEQKCQSGQYINTTGSTITFDIRINTNWSCSIGRAYGGTDEDLARTIQIYEMQR
jgi:hypothetical protein